MDTLELHASRQLARDAAAERGIVEEALRRSEGRLRRMAANTPGMLFQFVLNPDGSFYFPFVGEGCREFYGVEPQALYDRPERVLDVLEPHVRDLFLASLHAVRPDARHAGRPPAPTARPTAPGGGWKGFPSPRRSAAARCSGTG